MDKEGMGENPDRLCPWILGSSYKVVHVAGHVHQVPHVTYNMGGVVATFINGEGERPVKSWSLGRELLQFNADTFTLARMAQALALYYTDEVTSPQTLYICSPSMSALMAVSNPMLHHSRDVHLMWCYRTMCECLLYGYD